MTIKLKEASVFSEGHFHKGDVSFEAAELLTVPTPSSVCPSLSVFPGFTDVHVHFREPGFSYKETVVSGSLAAAHGGFTSVCTMPNLNPVPDTLAHLNEQRALIEAGAVIRVHPFGSITKGQDGRALSDMEALAPYVCGFSDDGRGVDNAHLMEEAMVRAAALGKVISAHCEDGTAPKDSPEAEWHEIERDIKLADKTKVKYHVCHISTKESVSLIREAKKSGVDITAETAPHYLTLTDAMKEDSGNYRMNPPLRDEADRLALIEGILDGTIDMIATDHAPHSAEEKGRGWAKSLNGVVGLETSFPIMYTEFVKPGYLSLEALIGLMSVSPKRRFGLSENSFTVYDLSEEYTVRAENFLSMGKSSPFLGRRVAGRCVATVLDGRAVYIDKNYFEKH